jgi:LacI family transcriptional regulator
MKGKPKRKSLVTLDDIARQLKVSRVTVSKALRGHPDISESTAQAVRRVAEEIGYRPNIIARTLSSRRSNMVGLVVPKIAHFFFGSVIEGVYNAAFSNNYETLLTVSQENPERERKHLQTLVSMRVDGIIISISQGTQNMEVFEWIQKLGIPLMFLDRQPDPCPQGFSSVLVDDHGGAYKAVEHAIHIGYRNIACLGGSPHVNISKNRYLGFEEAMKEHGLPVKKQWVVAGGFGKEAGYDGLLRFHAEKEIPEMVFAMTYPVALGVYEAAKELGLRIPQDLDVICFGDSDVGRVISPALSCVRQPNYELGAKAMELMVRILTAPETARDHHLVLPTDLVLRETCTGKHAISPPKILRGPGGIEPTDAHQRLEAKKE